MQRHEVSALDETLLKLTKMQKKYLLRDDNSSHQMTESESLPERMNEGNGDAGDKFGKVLNSIGVIVAVLKNAGVTNSGILISEETPGKDGESARTITAVQEILQRSNFVQKEFADVYRAFLPHGTNRLRGNENQEIRLTAKLLTRTIDALQQIGNRLKNEQVKATMRVDVKLQNSEKIKTLHHISELSNLNNNIEVEKKGDEVSFSKKFTEVVLKMDRVFAERVQQNSMAKGKVTAELIEIREREHEILNNLIEINGGEYAPSQQDDEKHEMSFLQTSLASDSKLSLLNVQSKVEKTLHNHQDTHALLVQIKEMLDYSTPVDADSVQAVVKDMGSVLQAVENEQSHADEAARQCNFQQFHGKEEVENLQNNVKMMGIDHAHSMLAVTAAKNNLKGIAVKGKALTKSSRDFARICDEGLHTLQGQSQDRKTIIAAIHRAEEVEEAGGSASPALTLLQELQRSIAMEDSKNSEYASLQANFKEMFFQYVDDYVQLLKEREQHYENSLSALNLYVDELDNHEKVQSKSLNDETTLNGDSADLCKTINAFYGSRTHRRQKLRNELKVILPEVPSILLLDESGTVDT